MITGKDLYNSYYEEDEKLFSTGDSDLDDILEEVYYSGIEDGYDYAQREFAEEAEKKKSGLKTAGKVALGVGGATALAGGVGQNIIVDKVAKKVAEKKGLSKVGWGVATALFGPEAKKGSELTTKIIKGSKAMKLAKGADVGGTALALTGAGLLAANAIKNKRNKKKLKDSENKKSKD